MHGNHSAHLCLRHRVAICSNWRVLWPFAFQLHDSLISSKAERMLQNTIEIPQQELHQQGCWQLRSDESHFICCKSWPLQTPPHPKKTTSAQAALCIIYNSITVEEGCQMPITRSQRAKWHFRCKWTVKDHTNPPLHSEVKLWSLRATSGHTSNGDNTKKSTQSSVVCEGSVWRPGPLSDGYSGVLAKQSGGSVSTAHRLKWLYGHYSPSVAIVF